MPSQLPASHRLPLPAWEQHQGKATQGSTRPGRRRSIPTGVTWLERLRRALLLPGSHLPSRAGRCCCPWGTRSCWTLSDVLVLLRLPVLCGAAQAPGSPLFLFRLPVLCRTAQAPDSLYSCSGSRFSLSLLRSQFSPVPAGCGSASGGSLC